MAYYRHSAQDRQEDSIPLQQEQVREWADKNGVDIIHEFLGQLRRNGRGATTANHYLRAITMFSRWLVNDRRTNDDCLAHLRLLNNETDRCRVRRPLEMEEFARLVEAAEPGSMF